MLIRSRSPGERETSSRLPASSSVLLCDWLTRVRSGTSICFAISDSVVGQRNRKLRLEVGGHQHVDAVVGAQAALANLDRAVVQPDRAGLVGFDAQRLRSRTTRRR